MRTSLLPFLLSLSFIWLLHHVTRTLALSSSFSDLDALLKLKESMKARRARPDALQDWKFSASLSAHCSFSGVTCDSQSLRVTALNVSFIPLFGTLPPEIGLLDKLESLAVSMTNLTGHLPRSLASLTSLKHLDISHNAFAGNFSGEITAGMTQLVTLDAYDNNFTGPLPEEITKLENLKYLSLAGNYFNGEIPASYGDFKSLEYLSLATNSLTGKIPKSLSNVKTLKKLYLGYTNLYEGGIPEELGSLESLQLLDLAYCNLSGEIPPTLGALTNLDSLFLQFNKLSGTIPTELSTMRSLKSLDLSINSLTGEIPESFSNLTNLTLINFFQNRLRGSIPAFVGDLPNLETLQVWENNFSYVLPPNLGQNGRLLYFDVTKNHLTGLIPRDLCKGGRLRTFMITDNFFTGPIPDGIGGCKTLQKIRIGDNFLAGPVPPGIFDMPAVLIIELVNNRFNGQLPSEIRADSLGILTLSGNRFTGRIPAAMGNLRSLQTLYLDGNQFEGEIPGEVFHLPTLTEVNMSGNNLTGNIPMALTGCVSLTAVDLSRNMLVGQVPKGIKNMKDLSIFNLSRNHISGPIPDEIRFMTSLTTLDLSNNNFFGRVPTGGQFMVFDGKSFAGNPDLCFPHQRTCPSLLSPNDNTGKNHNPLSSKSTKVIASVIALTTVALLALVTVYIVRKRKLRRAMAWKLTTFQKLKDLKAEDVVECLKEENIIGKGGAGIVYRGAMPNGTDVAIKRLVGQGSGRNDYGFKAEIETLGKIRHRNIMRLLGYVSNKDTNLLLYEYMPNGSVGEWLHGAKGAHLRWEMRYRIAVEAARGLCYLHHDCQPLIIHRDVKSNNILLDGDFEAHVADFGLAKFLHDPGASQSMSSIAGSYGYIAPEYAYTLKVDEKSDVYSFGVVLLELIVGRKPVGEFGDGVDIVGWVNKTISELSQPYDAASVLAVVDPRLSGYPLTTVVHVFNIAMMCVKEIGHARPTMREVVHMLTNIPPQSNVDHNLINL